MKGAGDLLEASGLKPTANSDPPELFPTLAPTQTPKYPYNEKHLPPPLVLLLTIAIIMLGEMLAVGQCTLCGFGTASGTDAVSAGAAVYGDYSGGLGRFAKVGSISLDVDDAFAIGEMDVSGTRGYGFGYKSSVTSTEGLVIGHRLNSTASGSYIFGLGSGGGMTNSTANTMMFVMNSNVPTMTIADAGGASGSIGRVGIGTTDPSTLLHVMAKAVSSEGEPLARFSVSDDADGLLQIENGTPNNNKFSPTIVGVSTVSNQPGLYLKGRIYEHDDLGSVAAMIFDVRRVGDDTIAVRSLFQWRGYDGNKMLMDVDGNLGIGTASPTHRLHVNGTARTVQSTFLATSGGYNVGIGTTSPSGKLHVAGTVFVANLPGGSGAVDVGQNPLVSDQLIDLNGSKEIYKQNFEEFQFDREAFLNLSIRRFEWKEVFGGGTDVGMIAEEVGQQFPELAYYGYRREYISDGSIVSDSSGVPIQDSTQIEVRGVKYHKLALYLFSLVKDQDTRISQLEDMLSEQSAAISACCAGEPTPQVRLGSGGEKKQFTSEYILLRNDPNPFGDHTDISYETTDCSKCELIVTDVNGRIVKRIRVSEPSGIVRIYASDIGTGVYTYSLVQDGQILRTEKMVSTKN